MKYVNQSILISLGLLTFIGSTYADQTQNYPVTQQTRATPAQQSMSAEEMAIQKTLHQQARKLLLDTIVADSARLATQIQHPQQQHHQQPAPNTNRPSASHPAMATGGNIQINVDTLKIKKKSDNQPATHMANNVMDSHVKAPVTAPIKAPKDNASMQAPIKAPKDNASMQAPINSSPVHHKAVPHMSKSKLFVAHANKTLLFNIEKLSKQYGWKVVTNNTNKNDIVLFNTKKIVAKDYVSAIQQLVEGYPVKVELYQKNKVAYFYFIPSGS